MTSPQLRRFLFLQGPHGPFFQSLGRELLRCGARVSRLGINAGDAFFWRGLPGYCALDGPRDTWEASLKRAMDDGVTDLVCYGATRPFHALARKLALERGITIHAFEEGYLRPYWVTYERNGTNAQSALNELSIVEMEDSLATAASPPRAAPDAWGDTRQHVFWGAAYHAVMMAGRHSYPFFVSHRTPEPSGEFAIFLRHLLTMPLRRLRRRVATTRIRRATFPYHVVLCQLAHDANFRDNSNFENQAEFIDLVFSEFAVGGPAHHHLVIKAHPLEDGREDLPGLVRALSAKHDLQGRTHLLTGGKLAQLLDSAESAVTVNSTAAEQVLWRGLPLKAFGKATYTRPEFVSNQTLADFFAAPSAPDTNAYAIYRQFLLATSQVSGGFYAKSSRNRLLRRIPDLMLADESPYDRIIDRPASARQHIRLVT
ncbi:MAG: capsule biosynthesis protein CapA [Boseongicola sp.]|nr:capsule biosynthesis protein CapA [Boseongicola sp.]